MWQYIEINGYANTTEYTNTNNSLVVGKGLRKPSMIFLVEGFDPSVVLPLELPTNYQVAEPLMFFPRSLVADSTNFVFADNLLADMGYNATVVHGGNGEQSVIVWTIRAPVVSTRTHHDYYESLNFFDNLAATYQSPEKQNILTRAVFCHKIDRTGYCLQYKDETQNIHVTTFSTCPCAKCQVLAKKLAHGTQTALQMHRLSKRDFDDNEEEDGDDDKNNSEDCGIITWKKLFLHSFYGMPATFCTWEQAQKKQEE